jgi:hypothetical protein
MVLRVFSGTVGGGAQGSADDFMQSNLRLKGGKNYVKLIAISFKCDKALVAGDTIWFQITTKTQTAIVDYTDSSLKWFDMVDLPAGSLQSIQHYRYNIREPRFQCEDLFIGYDTNSISAACTITFRLVCDISPSTY